MTHELSHKGEAAGALEDDVRASQIRQLFAQGPIGLVSTLIGALILTGGLWNAVSRVGLVAWLTCFLLLQLPRYLLLVAYRNRVPANDELAWWGNWFVVGNWASALAWSSVSVFLFPAESIPHQLLLAVFVGGAACGVSAVYWPVKSACIPTIVLLLIPLSARFIYEAEEVPVFIGTVMPIFAGILVVMAHRLNRTGTESLRLRFENRSLIQELQKEIEVTKRVQEELRKSHDELEDRVARRTSEISKINERLLQEIDQCDRAEKALKESETKYRELAESLPQWVFEIDVKGHFSFVNQSGLELSGYTNEDLAHGVSALEVVIPEDVPRIAADIARTMSGERIGSQEYTHRRKDGTIVPVVAESFPIVRDGKIVGVRGIAVDISERKRAEKLLAAQRDLSKSLSSTSDLNDALGLCIETALEVSGMEVAGIYVRNEAGGFELAAHRGVSEEFLSRASFVPSESDQAKLLMEGRPKYSKDESPPEVVSVLQGEGLRAIGMIPILHENRTIACFSMASRSLGEVTPLMRRTLEALAGQIGAAITRIMAEKTLRENGQTLRSMFENSLEGIILSLPGGHVIKANPAACELFAMTEEQLCALKKEDLFYISDAGTKGFIEQRDLFGRAVGEVNLKRGDRTVFPAEISSAMFASPKGQQITVSSIRDVSERKRATERILKEKEFSEMIMESLPGTFYLFDENANLLRWNRNLERISGFTHEEIAEMRSLDFFEGKDRSIIEQAFKVALNSGESSPEAEWTCKDGTKLPYLFTARRITYDDKPCVIGTGVDISERKRAEEELNLERERFQMLSENAPFGMLMVAKDGTCEYVNPKFTEIVGYELSDIHSGRDWYRKAHPDPEYRHQVIAAWIEDVEKKARLEDPGSRIFTVTCKDGSTKIIQFKLVRAGSGDDIVTLEDVTERTQAEIALTESEERYRKLFEESRDAISITTRNGAVLDVNQSFLDLFGFTHDELKENGVWPLYVDNADRRRFQHDLEQRGSLKDYEAKRRTKDGRVIDCLLSCSVITGHEGEIEGYRVSYRDVTEQKNLERQLVQAQKMEAIGTLAGGIAHDFNNLLQVVLGYTDLILSETTERDSQYSDLQRIFQAGKNGADLVQRLLTFSRKTEFRPRPMNLCRQIEDMSKLLSRTLPKMIGVELILGENLPAINADPTQIEQVLMNLAVNARDAMPEGGTLTIKTQLATLDEEYCRGHVDAVPGRYVLLSVSDTGSGIDTETLDHIFEPFYTTKAPGQGTGLGLAVVYGIVRQHSGHITCYSEPGEGTTFKIYLPVVEEQGAMTGEAVAGENLPGGHETILLVDDENLIRDLGKRILSRFGYEVLLARNGKEALEVYRREQGNISLIIMDLIMPEMGGKQCMTELLKMDSSVKVLVASGYASGTKMTDATEIGARGFIRKPFDRKILLQSVREILDS